MPTGIFRRIVVVTLFVLVAGTLTLSTAQEKPPSAESGPFKNLKYRLIGPAAGGRVSRSAGVPGNPLVYYAGTASGGVWKSSDGGYRWSC